MEEILGNNVSKHWEGEVLEYAGKHQEVKEEKKPQTRKKGRFERTPRIGGRRKQGRGMEGNTQNLSEEKIAGKGGNHRTGD